ncbi:hypothetical protein ACFPK9_09285 [Rubritalea spongiae]|uniref:Uncharacterized protein n=1 Tax=Rubritalea spongiae TaxID=430797 RepID=A0ABW5E3T4_9BACT
MKSALKILSLALVAMLFSSCSQEAIYYDASGNSVTHSSEMSSKGKFVEPAPEPVVVKKQKKEKQSCMKCLSSFCPKPGCCGTVGENVLSRATMQGGTGEPQLGLIPTMKTLAP